MAPTVQPVIPAIRFFEPVDGMAVEYTFAIIVSRYRGKWIWVQHRNRDTWELPAGHLEQGETALQAAVRELFEETGAVDYLIDPVISYEGFYQGSTVYGMIFLAEILELGPLPEFEIRCIDFFENIPINLTYPLIQPEFFNYIINNRLAAH